MNIVPLLSVTILDSDPVFCDRLSVLLGILGIRDIQASQSAPKYADFAKVASCDLAFVEIADTFEHVWAQIEEIRKKGVLIVGVSDDRSPRNWVSAVRRGADTILLKPYYPHLLREMLLRLVESPAAWRCRLVQFPARSRQREHHLE